jgi:hypothetical protein
MGAVMSWQWYEWDNTELFDTWHQEIKSQLGLPKLSVNSEGNEIFPLIAEYTEAVVSGSKVIAMVEEKYANDLVSTDLRPPKLKQNL